VSHSTSGQFHYRRVAFSFQLKSRIDSIIAKAATLRITLNKDGATVALRSHSHPSHSQTSLLLTTSLRLSSEGNNSPPLCFRCSGGHDRRAFQENGRKNSGKRIHRRKGTTGTGKCMCQFPSGMIISLLNESGWRAAELRHSQAMHAAADAA
jgi:hypothetical protein